MPTGYDGSTPQAVCHPDRKMWCKGLCKSCYYRPYIKQKKTEGKVYPSHTYEAKRRGHLKVLGWTPELYEKVLEEQEEKCAICKKPMILFGGAGGSRACADHEHVKPPKPRGILCGDCNTGLGKFKDNIEALRAAIVYNEKFC